MTSIVGVIIMRWFRKAYSTMNQLVMSAVVLLCFNVAVRTSGLGRKFSLTLTFNAALAIRASSIGACPTI